jgi:hypothetical protein
MTEKMHAPRFIKPGETVRFSDSKGAFMDFIGTQLPAVLDFIEAYAEYRLVKNNPVKATDATLKYTRKKVDKAWDALPASVFMEIERRSADAADA